MTDRLYRSRDDRMLAGVAAGIADYWDADPSLVRIIWALLVIPTGGVALLVYIVMAIVVPEEPSVFAAAASTAGAPDAAASQSGSWSSETTIPLTARNTRKSRLARARTVSARRVPASASPSPAKTTVPNVRASASTGSENDGGNRQPSAMNAMPKSRMTCPI